MDNHSSSEQQDSCSNTDLFREEVKSIATANLLMWFPLVRSLQTLGATLNESLEPKYSGNEFELRGHLFLAAN